MAHHMKALILLAILIAAGCSPSTTPGETTLSLGGEEWTLELAVTPEEIQTGLMHRNSIAPGTGMIFIFPDSRVHSFWMAYCLTDIDLMYVDGTGRITATHTMKVEPPRGEAETERTYLDRMPGYSSVFPARVAIELPAGSIRRLGLEAGDPTGLDMRAIEDLRSRVATDRWRAGSREQP